MFHLLTTLLEKKYSQQSRVHLILINFSVWLLVLLLFLPSVNKSWSPIIDFPWDILKTSIKSCIKLGRFWWNLVHRFLNKFALKPCKRFLPHLNNVSTLKLEMLNCTPVTVELLQKETPEFIPSQLWPPFARFEIVDNSMLEVLQEKVYRTRITALELPTTPLTNVSLSFCMV